MMKMVLLTSVEQRVNYESYCGIGNSLLSKKETGSERLATCATSVGAYKAACFNLFAVHTHRELKTELKFHVLMYFEQSPRHTFN